MVAGHTFGPSANAQCDCGQRFVDIAPATPENVGQTGWAHTGCLTAKEYEEIVAEKERIWACVAGVSAQGAGR